MTGAQRLQRLIEVLQTAADHPTKLFASDRASTGAIGWAAADPVLSAEGLAIQFSADTWWDDAIRAAAAFFEIDEATANRLFDWASGTYATDPTPVIRRIQAHLKDDLKQRADS